jgi:hypothetical protein
MPGMTGIELQALCKNQARGSLASCAKLQEHRDSSHPHHVQDGHCHPRCPGTFGRSTSAELMADSPTSSVSCCWKATHSCTERRCGLDLDDSSKRRALSASSRSPPVRSLSRMSDRISAGRLGPLAFARARCATEATRIQRLVVHDPSP